MKTETQSVAFRRAALPEILFAEDLGLALGIPTDDAEAMARTGRLGPAFMVRGRPAVLREHFLEALANRGAAAPDDREVAP